MGCAHEQMDCPLAYVGEGMKRGGANRLSDRDRCEREDYFVAQWLMYLNEVENPEVGWKRRRAISRRGGVHEPHIPIEVQRAL